MPSTSVLHYARALLLAALASIAAFGPAAAFAQALPVRILVGFPAGGGVDAVARLLANQLEKQTGRSYRVENRPGAGGLLAARALVAASADGSTLMVAPDSAILVSPYTVSAPGFNALTDLAPVSRLTAYDFALSVRADSAPQSLQAFRDAAKSRPKGVNIANPAAGGLLHFYSMVLASSFGIGVTHVPYRGVAPAIVDTLGGEVDALLTPSGPVLQHAESGRLRILATTGTERGAKTPNVPTMKELGYPQLSSGGWFGLFAPAKTPPELVQRIADSVRQALADPEIQAKLAALDMEAVGSTPQAFRATVESESRHWSTVVKASGFRSEL